MTRVRPYGDWTDDGKVQLSFTLPVAAGERARRAALDLATQMGLTRAMVVHMKALSPGHTFFVVYGATEHSVELDRLEVTERGFPVLPADEVNRLIEAKLKRPLVVAGACTGSDAHTVGLDAILSLKGYGGDKGLEYYNGIRVLNLGSQVDPEDIVATVRDEGVDAVLVSQVVTQRDAHIRHLVDVREALEAEGLRDGVLLIGGGPRFDPAQAADLGYDHIFGRGTKPSEVASYLAWAVGRVEGAA